MSRTADSKVRSASKAGVIVAGTAYDYSDLAQDNKPVGFHANQSGNLIATLSEDDANATFIVVQGGFYPYALVSIDEANEVAGVVVFN